MSISNIIKSARVASKTGAFNLILDLSKVDGDGSRSLAVLAALARSSLTICSGVIGCIIIFFHLNMRE
jgi:anti-anti-sigma regulatory factor